jgi:hypothetical protein
LERTSRLSTLRLRAKQIFQATVSPQSHHPENTNQNPCEDEGYHRQAIDKITDKKVYFSLGRFHRYKPPAGSIG